MVHQRPDGPSVPPVAQRGPHETGNRTAAWCGALRDISQIKNSEEKITYLAYHDAPHRIAQTAVCFNDRLKVAIATATRKRQRLALLFMDLDNFKHVNDGLGHVGRGRAVAGKRARRLQGKVRNEDTVARLGGDEFISLLVGHPGAGVRRGGGPAHPGLPGPALPPAGTRLLHIGQRGHNPVPGRTATTPEILLANADNGHVPGQGRGPQQLQALHPGAQRKGAAAHGPGGGPAFGHR